MSLQWVVYRWPLKNPRQYAFITQVHKLFSDFFVIVCICGMPQYEKDTFMYPPLRTICPHLGPHNGSCPPWNEHGISPNHCAPGQNNLQASKEKHIIYNRLLSENRNRTSKGLNRNVAISRFPNTSQGELIFTGTAGAGTKLPGLKCGTYGVWKLSVETLSSEQLCM